MSHDLHPIVAQMHPSEEQLPPILARGSDVVVTAGAGAGKTRTLVARYLSLLVDAAAGRAEIPVRSVVAITFTKKAAREMRNRVREEVRRYLQREGLTEEERARWQAVYEQLDAARIGTIHSLCAEILRRHPAEIGIDRRFGFREGVGSPCFRRRLSMRLSAGQPTIRKGCAFSPPSGNAICALSSPP